MTPGRRQGTFIGMYRCDGPWIVDREGRRIIFRGVNLGGGSKRPIGSSAEDDALEALYSGWREASFVGKPFPLEQARAHFGLLRSWGLRLIRLVCTWEAIEHAGPGIYDARYLDYLRALCEEAASAGLDVWLDPHQDVFSRWTGGDGAPAWTLEAAGLDLRALHASGAAIVEEAAGRDYPDSIWSTNYNRLGCAAMFTLFFGGNDFAPGMEYRGRPIQDFLQDSYLAAMGMAARALKGLPNIVGFGTMNEPSLGFIGQRDIRVLERWHMRRGLMPTPLEAMAAGEGLPARVERWVIDALGNHRAGRGLLNPDGVRAWADGRGCPWKKAGVWGQRDGRAVALKPDFFKVRGRPADLYLKPFYRRMIVELRRHLPEALAFIEGVPNGESPGWGPEDPAGAVNASHWYDGLTFVSKRYQELFTVDAVTMAPTFFKRGVRDSFRRQLARLRDFAAAEMGGIPTLVGEFGLPFDLRGRGASREAGFRDQERALSAYYRALDELLLPAALWNYAPDNAPGRGDGWNREDFSIYCTAQGGPRALRGFSRPYALRTAGLPLKMSFDPGRARFQFDYEPDMDIQAPTEIFVPECWYPHPPALRVLSGRAAWSWRSQDRLIELRAAGPERLSVEILPGKA